MTITDEPRRRVARLLASMACLLAMVSTMLCGWALASLDVAAAAAVDAGDAQVVTPAGGAGSGQPLTTGGSATSFNLKLPAGAACAADGNNGGRWHTYMVPSSEDPAAVTFTATGALIAASVASDGSGTFRNNLYSTVGNPVRGQAPNLGDAAIINVPNMNFALWTPGNIPVGTYDLGIACIDLDLASARDNFWNVQIVIAEDPTDPIGIRWTVPAPATTTTTTTTTSSTSTTPSTTSTTGATTSTIDVLGTSSTLDLTRGTDAADLGSVLGGSTGGPGGGSLPATGSYVLRFVVSAFLLVVLGRMAVLLGRPMRVLEPDR